LITIIAGSRSVTPVQFVAGLGACPWRHHITEVVSGTALGADRLGEEWAEEQGIAVRRMPADWDRYGKKAGFLRNREMAQVAEALIALWDGTSPGTRDMVKEGRERGLEVFLYYVRTGKVRRQASKLFFSRLT